MDNRTIRRLCKTAIFFIFATAAVTAVAADRLLTGDKNPLEPVEGENYVRHRCLTPPASERIILPLERDNPWSLPKAALAADFVDTVNILVLRFNFQFEDPDDPNTTGRGIMDVTTTPEQFFDTAGHIIDSPPHDSLYFDAHMRALRTYWETVSDDHLTITWDIYPSGAGSTYQLPQPMNYYGKCDFGEVIAGLEAYFIDCIQVADATTPEIDFGQYESIILFHAGSDGQNDIGFPPTCNDLFTGFITFGDSLAVDNDSNHVRTALIMPETANQDNRATGLNGVLAHEFGHQLGLVDLYSTSSFMSMLGDFALMDNNGFGSGIDFGFDVGSVFGIIPVYPTAWSRAFLGFVEVKDYRQETDIGLVAAEMISQDIKVARIPITEYEYYLIENRSVEIDGEPEAARLDEERNVILYPSDTFRVFSREYDFLLPGSGLLIFHVDERVAALDYDYNGVDNFSDNHLQWSYDVMGNRVDQFITLVEADGVVNFGGIYRAGYGEADDMFRDDRNHSFTPNTNPPAIDNSGNNTHIYITNIMRAADTSGSLVDTLITFDVATDRLAAGFPVRAGQPVVSLSPISDDLDGDGNPELIFASNDRLCVATTDGQNFLRQYTGCTTCPEFEDTAYASVNFGQSYPVPLYARTFGTILAGPVTGEFSDDAGNRLVAVGYGTGIGATGRVELYSLRDDDNNGQADLEHGIDTSFFNTIGMPVAMSFGDVLWVVTDSGLAYRKGLLNEAPTEITVDETATVYGIARSDDKLLVLFNEDGFAFLYYVDIDRADGYPFDDGYEFGPVLADLDRDGLNEVILCSADGGISVRTLDGSASGSALLTPLESLSAEDSDCEFTANPVISDVDLDGYPDIVVAGPNAIYAFNRQLTLMTDFPIEINDRFPDDPVIAAPVVADIQESGVPEIVVSTEVGNIYSFGLNASYGFPLSAGEISSGSPVFVNDTVGGRLGYLGADGWFYLWNVDDDEVTNFWPMYGADPGGSFAFDAGKLGDPKEYATRFDEKSFYNYPNPVVDGSTTIRYFLGIEAVTVELDIYDMSGQLVEQLEGPTDGGVDNEIVWHCGDITPGIYRCVININFGEPKETAFTDIAIIR